MKYVLRLTLIAVVLAGCERDPLGYDYTDQYSLSVLQGGDGGVYFMPPLLQSTFSGEFAPDGDPVVVVCAGAPAGPCDNPVAVLDRTLDAGEDESEVVQVDLTSEKYMVNWKASGEARGLYRIFVVEDGERLAYIDVALVQGRTSSGGNTRGVRIYGAEATREFSGTLPIAFRMEVRAEPEPEGGLLAQYFDWSALTAPDFAQATPIRERLDPALDFSSPDGAGDVFGIGQGEYVLARWSGFIVAPSTGWRTICAEATNGFRLWFDGTLFYNRWFDQPERPYCFTLSMEEGIQRPILIEWYHRTGAATLRLMWQTGPDDQVVIPASALVDS